MARVVVRRKAAGGAKPPPIRAGKIMRQYCQRGDVRVNVPRILAEMARRNWTQAEACAVLGVNSRTLANVLKGNMPRRLDALFRILNGLNIPIEQGVITDHASAH